MQNSILFFFVGYGSLYCQGTLFWSKFYCSRHYVAISFLNTLKLAYQVWKIINSDKSGDFETIWSVKVKLPSTGNFSPNDVAHNTSLDNTVNGE